MPSKELYCYRILKAYSLIVDFNGVPPRENVPAPIEKETFSKWKLRVLGEGVSDVRIFQPTDPKPQTLVNTLRSIASASHMEKLFKSINDEHKRKKKSAIDVAVEKTENSFKSFPKDTLIDLLESKALEPSVSEFFSRFTTSTENDIDTESLLSDLIDVYNEAVKSFRNRG